MELTKIILRKKVVLGLVVVVIIIIKIINSFLLTVIDNIHELMRK